MIYDIPVETIIKILLVVIPRGLRSHAVSSRSTQTPGNIFRIINPVIHSQIISYDPKN
jgi:hypothetical protein